MANRDEERMRVWQIALDIHKVNGYHPDPNACVAFANTIVAGFDKAFPVPEVTGKSKAVTSP